jgi:hypothetical protein
MASIGVAATRVAIGTDTLTRSQPRNDEVTQFREVSRAGRGDCALEFDFRAQSCEIPVDDGDRELSTAAAIRDRAVAGLERYNDL